MNFARPIPGWSPSTPEVRGPAIDDLLRQNPAIAIHFWAAWNGVDPLLDRSIQEILDRFIGRLWFGACDVDLSENAELCGKFGVANIPAIGILVSGRSPKLIVGYRDPQRLALEIERRLYEPKRKHSWIFWK